MSVYIWYDDFKPFYKGCDIMIRIGTQGRVHFWICLLNMSFDHKRWAANRYG